MSKPKISIPVNEPVVSKLAKKYVNEALDSGWISSAGKFIDSFESSFAKYLGVKFASTVSNGTVALHLALLALDIGPGDEVIVPDLTIVSCALAVMYTGAKPVLVDVDPDTGNIDPLKIEASITPKTKAIMVVHLFGNPCNMELVMQVAQKHSLKVVEDAAEAHGAMFKGQKVGSFGHVATFSFYANKIVTTGEGGMVVTSDPEIHKRVTLLKNLAHMPGKRFWHEQIGYNYRLTNIQAAMGLAHLEEIETFIAKKRWMKTYYQELLSDISQITLPEEKNEYFNVFWMYNILVNSNSGITRDQLMGLLLEKGIDTRSYFYPLHEQPILSQFDYDETQLVTATNLSYRGLYLPSGLTITEDQMIQVSEAIHAIYRV